MLRDLMREGFLICVRRGDTVADAVAAMTTNDVGIVSIIDGAGLAGVLSERDVVQRVVARGLDPRSTTVDSVMTSDVVTAEDTMDFKVAMEIMAKRKIRHLPVVRGDRLVSMLSIRDLMWAEREELEIECRELHAYIHAVSPDALAR